MVRFTVNLERQRIDEIVNIRERIEGGTHVRRGFVHAGRKRATLGNRVTNIALKQLERY